MDVLRRLRAACTVPDWVVNRRALILRRLFRPLQSRPFVVKKSDGSKFILSEDPLDEPILLELFGHFQDLFFPPDLPRIPDGGIILDVGAHHGMYTVAALHRYPNATVLAVEPDPAGSSCFARTCA